MVLGPIFWKYQVLYPRYFGVLPIFTTVWFYQMDDSYFFNHYKISLILKSDICSIIFVTNAPCSTLRQFVVVHEGMNKCRITGEPRVARCTTSVLGFWPRKSIKICSVYPLPQLNISYNLLGPIIMFFLASHLQWDYPEWMEPVEIGKRNYFFL